MLGKKKALISNIDLYKYGNMCAGVFIRKRIMHFFHFSFLLHIYLFFFFKYTMTTAALNYDNNGNMIVSSLRDNYNNDNRLHSLVASGQLERVQRLIASGCDPNSSHSITGLKPIHFAASRGHVDLVHYLVQSSQVQIDAVDKEGEVSIYTTI